MSKIREIDTDIRYGLLLVITMVVVALLIAVALKEFGGFALADAVFGGLLLSVVGFSVIIIILAIVAAFLGLMDTV